MSTAPFAKVDSLLHVMAGSARFADVEDVDLLAHALQCAQLLRDVAPDDVELQVAGLVHDVGTALVPDAPDSLPGTRKPSATWLPSTPRTAPRCRSAAS